MSKPLVYQGKEPSNVCIGDRRIQPGDTISGPDDLLLELAALPDFATIDLAEAIEPARKKKKAE